MSNEVNITAWYFLQGLYTGGYVADFTASSCLFGAPFFVHHWMLAPINIPDGTLWHRASLCPGGNVSSAPGVSFEISLF